jgi:hypothetical protein
MLVAVDVGRSRAVAARQLAKVHISGLFGQVATPAAPHGFTLCTQLIECQNMLSWTLRNNVL